MARHHVFQSVVTVSAEPQSYAHCHCPAYDATILLVCPGSTATRLAPTSRRWTRSLPTRRDLGGPSAAGGLQREALSARCATPAILHTLGILQWGGVARGRSGAAAELGRFFTRHREISACFVCTEPDEQIRGVRGAVSGACQEMPHDWHGMHAPAEPSISPPLR